MILSTTTNNGTVAWIAHTRAELEAYTPGLRERGERWRIYSRVIEAHNEKAFVWIMLINPPRRAK